jgi:natural product biosynthesis luciferase-like monooxygenase protein
MAESTTPVFLLSDQPLVLSCANELTQCGFAVGGVITDSEALGRYLSQFGVQTVTCEVFGQSFVPAVKRIVVGVGWRAEFPEIVLQSAAMCIGVHDGSLPDFAGPQASTRALAEGRSNTLLTWFMQDSFGSTIAVIDEQPVRIDEKDTLFDLNARIAIELVDHLSEVVRMVQQSEVQSFKQLQVIDVFGVGSSEAFEFLPLTSSVGEVDRCLRSLDTGPQTRFDVGRPKFVLHGEVCIAAEYHCDAPFVGQVNDFTDLSTNAMPGTVVAIGAGQLTIALKDGSVTLVDPTSINTGESVHAVIGDFAGSTVGSVQLQRIGLPSSKEAVPARPSSLHFPWISSDMVGGNDGLQTAAINLPKVFAVDNVEASDGAEGGDAALIGAVVSLLHRCTGVVQVSCVVIAPSDAISTRVRCWNLELGFDSHSSFELLMKQVRVQMASPSMEIPKENVKAFTSTATLAFVLRTSVATGATTTLRLSSETLGEGLRLTARLETVSALLPDLQLAAEQIETILEDGLNRPSAPIGDLCCFGPQDLLLLSRFNPEFRDIDELEMLPQQISQQCERTPDRVALTDGARELSYGELATNFRSAARVLSSTAVGADSFVGVHMERSFELVVWSLAIWAVGAAYVPFDPTYPTDRSTFVGKDARLSVVLSDRPSEARKLFPDARVIDVRDVIPPESSVDVLVVPRPSDAAYMIYTSGSTGLPKGVVVEHGNLVNFAVGMDEVLGTDTGTWMAVTSLSFDISVLELFWTLARGSTVVLQTTDPRTGPGLVESSEQPRKARLSIAYFGGEIEGQNDSLMSATESSERTGTEKYRLVLEGARRADVGGLHAVWIPERHFHAFGGLFPNPSVIASAIAVQTSQIAIRAGSVVAPLHSPFRIAEEWSVVDNLSGGRVGISFASGWHPLDFVIQPSTFNDKRNVMRTVIDQVSELWAGRAVSSASGTGELVETRIRPLPIQPKLPMWITSSGSPETFAYAGTLGANILTHLLDQTPDQLAEKIHVYREARKIAGHADEGEVTLLIHTCATNLDTEIDAVVEGPFASYIAQSVDLVGGFADAWIDSNQGAETQKNADLASLDDTEQLELARFAARRLTARGTLFGSPEAIRAQINSFEKCGITEIACLVDFGVTEQQVLASIDTLCSLIKEQSSETSVDQGIPQLMAQTKVTHLQCTPSLARFLISTDEGVQAVRNLDHLMVGGEALPVSLASELAELVTGRLTNMYGPTETTIWSSTAEVTPFSGTVTVGRPIHNTVIHLFDDNDRPVPIGSTGRVFIGGDGVARGYFQRDELTAERFRTMAGPTGEKVRLYDTGDVGRLRSDGTLELLGRADQQIKLHGYRIELGEIETALERVSGIDQAVVLAPEIDDGDRELVAYVVGDSDVTVELLQKELNKTLPSFMVPVQYKRVDSFPLTPNGKIDRNALALVVAPPLTWSSVSVANEPKLQTTEAGIASTNQGTSLSDSLVGASETERIVTEIWQAQLGRTDLETDTNFFDLGAHSFVAIRVHRRLAEQFGENVVTLTDIFRFPTVRQLVHHIQGIQTTSISTPDAASSVVADDARARGRKRRMLRQ